MSEEKKRKLVKIKVLAPMQCNAPEFSTNEKPGKLYKPGDVVEVYEDVAEEFCRVIETHSAHSSWHDPKHTKREAPRYKTIRAELIKAAA